jgi:hypothetical protein
MIQSGSIRGTRFMAADIASGVLQFTVELVTNLKRLPSKEESADSRFLPNRYTLNMRS